MTMNRTTPQEVEPFPGTTLAVAGVVMCLIGIVLGIATATGGLKLSDGVGLSAGLGFLVLLLLVVLAAKGVRSLDAMHDELRRRDGGANG